MHNLEPKEHPRNTLNKDTGNREYMRPFIKGRDLDLSQAAAEEIGLIPYGVKKMKIRVLE